MKFVILVLLNDPIKLVLVTPQNTFDFHMALDAVQNVENYIRDIAKDRRCRFDENFLDYDNLRSGYVTGNIV